MYKFSMRHPVSGQVYQFMGYGLYNTVCIVHMYVLYKPYERVHITVAYKRHFFTVVKVTLETTNRLAYVHNV